MCVLMIRNISKAKITTPRNIPENQCVSTVYSTISKILETNLQYTYSVLTLVQTDYLMFSINGLLEVNNDVISGMDKGKVKCSPPT